MAKVRVHELAKKYGVPSKDVLSMLSDLGEFVKAPSSTVEPPVVKRFEDKHGAELLAKAEEKAPELFIEFMGTKIRVQEGDDGGNVKEEDVPVVKGAALKFEGAGEATSFDEVKVRCVVRTMRLDTHQHS